MRLILLLSFLLPGFLVTVAYVVSDYDYEIDDNTLYDEDYLLFENPAVPLSKDNERPAFKYNDIREDEEKTPEFKGNEVLDSEDDEEDSVVSDPVNSVIDRSNFDRNDLDDDYENIKMYKYRQSYPVTNYFKRDRRSLPVVIKPRKPNLQHPRGMYFPQTPSINNGHRRTPCNQGYRRDSRGRCRKILR